MSFQIGLDVGGTFTDFIVAEKNGFKVGKVLSTREDESVGVMAAISSIADGYQLDDGELLRQTDLIVLGTTVVANMMLEYNGANTGLITTKGFRDMIELRRNYKESQYDIRLPAPYPIVPRQKRLGVAERINHSGKILIPLDEEEVRQAVRRLKELGVEAIAICTLFSFVNPVHEQRVREIVLEEYPEAFVSLSCEVLPQVREFERQSTTIVNAYVSPRLQVYLGALERRLKEKGFAGDLFVVQSNGGMMDIEYSGRRGVEVVLSGPCGGVVGGVFAGGLSGHKDLITVDMGGTSYDICLIKDGQPKIGVDSWISRYRVATPMVDIHSIGAGGGSIAWVDEGGALRVGPRSAGAEPGPACYGRGGKEPTVTDADVILGYINPDFFLGGKMRLDVGAAREAIESRIARPLGISLTEAASGIFRLVNSTMTNGIRYVSVSRGYDPREFALMAFGGAGPIHAGMQAKDLGINTILVPKNAAVFSALGGLISDIKISKVRSFIRRSTDMDLNELNEVLFGMWAEAENLLGDQSKVREVVVQRAMDIRYLGQTHEVTVPIRTRTRRITDVNLAGTFRDFHRMHEELYTFKRLEQPIEVLTLRLDLIGVRNVVKFESSSFHDEDPSKALKGARQVWFVDRGYIDTPVYDGSLARPGNLIAGPAVIEEPDTSIVIYPGQEALLDQYQTFVIESAQ